MEGASSEHDIDESIALSFDGAAKDVDPGVWRDASWALVQYELPPICSVDDAEKIGLHLMRTGASQTFVAFCRCISIALGKDSVYVFSTLLKKAVEKKNVDAMQYILSIGGIPFVDAVSAAVNVIQGKSHWFPFFLDPSTVGREYRHGVLLRSVQLQEERNAVRPLCGALASTPHPFYHPFHGNSPPPLECDILRSQSVRSLLQPTRDGEPLLPLHNDLGQLVVLTSNHEQTSGSLEMRDVEWSMDDKDVLESHTSCALFRNKIRDDFISKLFPSTSSSPPSSSSSSSSSSPTESPPPSPPTPPYCRALFRVATEAPSFEREGRDDVSESSEEEEGDEESSDGERRKYRLKGISLMLERVRDVAKEAKKIKETGPEGLEARLKLDRDARNKEAYMIWAAERDATSSFPGQEGGLLADDLEYAHLGLDQRRFHPTLHGEATTALHDALLHWNVEVVRILLRLGASITARTSVDGNTPLHIAVTSSAECFDAVISHISQLREEYMEKKSKSSPLDPVGGGGDGGGDGSGDGRGDGRGDGDDHRDEERDPVAHIINATNNYGHTPLKIALSCAEIETIRILEAMGGVEEVEDYEYAVRAPLPLEEFDDLD